MVFRTLLASILILGGTGSLTAQSIFAQDRVNGDFYSIDIKTGELILVADNPLWPYLWFGMAENTSGEVFVLGYQFQQVLTSEIYRVDPATGTLTFITDFDLIGVGGISFGPNDILYTLINLNYTAPGDFTLFSIDLQTGATTQIGSVGGTGITSVQAMDYDGTTMFVYDGNKGLHTLDLATGLVQDVNPGFNGYSSGATEMCFSDDGTLYLNDFAHWVLDPGTGIPSLAGTRLFAPLLGGMAYIPGPSQVLSLWQTERVGDPTEMKIRGATPGGQIAIFRSNGPDGSILIPGGFPCAGTVIDLNPVSLEPAALVTADAQGEIDLGPLGLPLSAKRFMQIQALDLNTCETSNTIRMAF